jgi:hypothetical protein
VVGTCEGDENKYVYRSEVGSTGSISGYELKLSRTPLLKRRTHIQSISVRDVMLKQPITGFAKTVENSVERAMGFLRTHEHPSAKPKGEVGSRLPRPPKRQA